MRLEPVKKITTLGGRQIDYAVEYSPRAKRSRIRVNPAGVAVTLPKGTEPGYAEDFLKRNEGWVLAQLDYVSRAGSITITAPGSEVRAILLRGVETPVRIVEEESTRLYAITEQARKHIRIRVPRDRHADADRALELWLRREARKDIQAALRKYTKAMRVFYNRLYIMNQKTKWAGCSARNNLSFSWRLVMAPPEVLEYIVVHELAHLIERDHSTRFWLIVGSHCPGYLKHRDWLRDNEHRLRV